jgi:phospholipase/carboxylesterase
VLPVDRCGRRAARELTSAGYDVVYDEVDAGHVVTPDRVATGLDFWLGTP